jgi:septum formation inhibitor-activating ATPase MinD
LSLSNDFIVVDTAGSIDKFARNLIERSTIVLFVTSGEVSSVRDTKAALGRLNAWEVPPEKVKIVLNRGAKADGFQVHDLEVSLGKSLFWELPRDREVMHGVQVGRPVVLEKPGAPAARNLVSLATLIGGNVRAPITQNGHGSGILRAFTGKSAKKVTS